MLTCTEELDDSVLLSSGGNQTDPQELSSWAASADALSDSGVPPAEPSHLVTQSLHVESLLAESPDSQSPPMDVLPVESFTPQAEPSSSAEDHPSSSPIDLLQSTAAESAEGEFLAQSWLDDQDASPAQSSHENDDEEPEDPHFE